jgi:hypothetical protein
MTVSLLPLAYAAVVPVLLVGAGFAVQLVESKL